MAAPRTRLHNVGGLYRINGELEEDGGEEEEETS